MKIKRFRPKTLAAVLPLAGLCCFGCFDDDDDNVITGNGNGQASHAVANMRSYTDTSVIGNVNFDLSGDSLVVTAVINGLLPGKAYGIHVHENGDCSTPEASGPHFVGSEPHGNPVDSLGTHHRGDLPNVQTDSSGVGRLTFSTNSIDLRTAAKSVVDRSVVMHAFPDDYLSQPAGNTGDRIACGVIRVTDQAGDTTGTGGSGGGGSGGGGGGGGIDY